MKALNIAARAAGFVSSVRYLHTANDGVCGGNGWARKIEGGHEKKREAEESQKKDEKRGTREHLRRCEGKRRCERHYDKRR